MATNRTPEEELDNILFDLHSHGANCFCDGDSLENEINTSVRSALIAWKDAERKSLAAELLEKGPLNRFDRHLDYKGFNEANAQWRSIIKEYLG